MGAENGYRYVTEFRVRFADLDALGHLNNIALLQLLETGRVDYVTDLGLGTHDELTYVIVSLHCDFRAQAHYRDVLTCGTRAACLGRTSLVLEQEVWKQDRTVVASATSTLVHLGEDTTSAAPVPFEWQARLERFEGRPVPPKGS